jgi:CRISPR-associated protein Cas2
VTMTVVVTRNVEGRVRGFLASAMLEIGAGVYTAPVMSPAVRERIWAVLVKWAVGSRGDSALMTWSDGHIPGGSRGRGSSAKLLLELGRDGKRRAHAAPPLRGRGSAP